MGKAKSDNTPGSKRKPNRAALQLDQAIAPPEISVPAELRQSMVRLSQSPFVRALAARFQLLGEQRNAEMAAASPQELTRQKTRKPGGGSKPKLSKEQIEGGKVLYCHMLNDDRRWADAQDASAKELIAKLNLGASPWTVKRWIVVPVLKERAE